MSRQSRCHGTDHVSCFQAVAHKNPHKCSLATKYMQEFKIYIYICNAFIQYLTEVSTPRTQYQIGLHVCTLCLCKFLH